MSKKEEDFIGDELRKIIKLPTDELAHKLNIHYETAKLIQTLISDFIKQNNKGGNNEKGRRPGYTGTNTILYSENNFKESYNC